jgi:thiamine-monophosphate kinase
MHLMNAIDKNRFLSRWAALLPRAPGQVGGIHETDAELLPLGDGRLLVLKVDSVVEEVTAGIYTDPETAGRIAVTSTLSDLAAVGADPLGILLSVTLPESERSGMCRVTGASPRADTGGQCPLDCLDGEQIQERVAAGVRDACERAETFVLGGDTNSGPTLAVGVCAAGIVPEGKHLSRLGAQPGDGIWAAGLLGLGGALAASTLLSAGGLDESEFRPEIRLGVGRALRGIASACMDTSDGFVATADQLARLNGVAFHVEVPLESLLHPLVEQYRTRVELPTLPFLASIHGEFELVFTVPPDREPALDNAARVLGWTPVRVGTVREGSGVYVGDVALDSTFLRNLLDDMHGDLAAYASHLLSYSPGT